MVGKKIFEVSTLTKVLGLYVLQSRPPTLQMTANNIYQSTEKSGSIPTLDKVLSKIEISLSQRNEQSNEEDCFELNPEKLEAFRARKIGREKAKDSSQKIFTTYSDSAILYSGASYSMFKDSSCFLSFKGTQISISLEDGSSITASGIGTAIILSKDGQPIYLQNSLIIHFISMPLIALGPFLKENCSFIGKGDVIELVSSN
ncbi:hypothetical protein O181_042165 [Austropuccinia psidii MF-1]|uniref:Retrovirus-related Pol polyprotein from transposon TNT 1-94-like beta-barrel domain-containing protein n=1 Tax=Austropuccinia psidii MF-1 TaxID=1389203 RepID=A0A9Q3HHW6_9BASI|nr:hypothetical protein [Austropuccinia psidii MF-1]